MDHDLQVWTSLSPLAAAIDVNSALYHAAPGRGRSGGAGASLARTPALSRLLMAIYQFFFFFLADEKQTGKPTESDLRVSVVLEVKR